MDRFAGLVTTADLHATFEAVAGSLSRYLALDPPAFRRAVDAVTKTAR